MRASSLFFLLAPAPCCPSGPTPSSVGGDPFTVYENKKAQFFLPPYKMARLTTCGNLTIDGQVQPSRVPGDNSQWFNKFAIAVGGQELVTVTSIRVDKLRTSTPSEAGSSTEDATDVVVEDGPAAQSGFQSQTDLPLTTLNVVVAGRKAERTAVKALAGNATVTILRHGSKRIGAGYVEMVEVTAGATSLWMQSTVAAKFADSADRVHHTHLDLHFSKIDPFACTGILPELWGTEPMSQATAELLVPSA